MPTAKRLPSGSYRVRVYSHTENGKRIYESFTADTKKEAELKAAEWQTKKDRRVKSDLTVKEAVTGYINAKIGVLSPSTIRGYNNMKFRYAPINDIRISKITSEQYQRFISDLSQRLSPKTVSNVHGLFMSAIRLYQPDKIIRVTLPKQHKPIKTAPSDKDVQRLFLTAPDMLKVCIALSAFGSLRRGEISALRYEDIREKAVYVHADYVKDTDGEWIYKPPKELSSVRLAPVPQAVIDMFGTGAPDEFIIKWLPDTITKRFIDHRNKCGVNVRFHDLRHYYASIGAVLGVPSNYLESFGGWAQGGKTMKEVYQNNIISMSDVYARKMAAHFEDLIRDKSGNE